MLYHITSGEDDIIKIKEDFLAGMYFSIFVKNFSNMLYACVRNQTVDNLLSICILLKQH